MTDLQIYKMELKATQIAILKKMAADLRQVSFQSVDASAYTDLIDAVVSINKALRKLKS